MTFAPSKSGSAPANLADVVRAAAGAAGDRPALIGSGGTRTWAELDRAVDAGAAALSGHPVGERVVLALPTGPDLAAAQFAVLRAGLVAVPVDPRRTDLEWVARRVGAVVAVTDEMLSGTSTVLSSAQVTQWWHGRPEPVACRAGGEDLAMLARSARSGPPVMLSHRAFLGAVAALRGAPRLDIQPGDRVLQVLPLFHVVGLVTAFLPAALVGAAVVVPDADHGGPPTQAALDAVRAHRVTILPAEPTLYRQLDRVPGFEQALATVRLMTSGSSPLDPADFAAIRTATGRAVREGYGISESAAAVTSTLMTGIARPGSVGLPYPGVQIRIADGAWDSGGDGDGVAGGERSSAPEPAVVPGGVGPVAAGTGGAASGPDDAARTAGGDGAGGSPVRTDTSGLVLSGGDDAPVDGTPDDGEVGPITIRGDTLFSGYWPDGHGGPGADGWFVTGDIGYLDDAGELHLVDRVAETVTVAGFTVYPREVEDVLVSHPYVADAAVVGVPGRGGPTVVAALVARPGTRPTHADLDEFLTDRLPPFKRPTDYQLVEVLPRTEVGRLDRPAVRQSYAEHHGIALDAPAHLRPAGHRRVAVVAQGVSGRGASAATADPGAAGGEQADATPDISPETAAGLDKLGVKLPAAGTRTRRSAQDTDEDLF